MHLLWLLFLPAAGYQLLAILAALLHLSQREPRDTGFSPPVSVLKPLRGTDPNSYPAFLSQALQRYPAFELLFGARAETDPAVALVHRLRQEYPAAPLRMIIGGAATANGKVGVLMNLAQYTQAPIWVVNDSDIKVDPEYLASIVAPLADPSVGVVTCLYRVKPHNAAAAWEALGVMTDFIPSTLVARLIGVREFGLGSTLVFRASDLERAGGFAALAGYLADDYQLAKHITSFGKRAHLSSYVVETSLGDATWRGVWHHQIRWARTIRVSRGGVYAGVPITQAGLWILIALLAGLWPAALVLAGLRLFSAALTGWGILHSRSAAALFWLTPLRDLYSFAVWLASYAGRKVRWRDQVLEIDAQGRIVSSEQLSSRAC